MTDRQSERELRRDVEQLRDGVGSGPYFGRPEPLSPEEKQQLNDLFAVDPNSCEKSRGQRFLERLHEREHLSNETEAN